MQLQGKNWKIEKLSERDIPELVSLFEKDASIPQGLELSRKDMRDLEEYFDKVLDAVADGERFYFMMRSTMCRRLMGGISFIQDENAGIWERSFWMTADFRGKGYASQATSLVTEWMFGQGFASELREMTRHSNTPSIRLKEKQGFQMDGLRPGGENLFRIDILHPANFIPQHI